MSVGRQTQGQFGQGAKRFLLRTGLDSCCGRFRKYVYNRLTDGAGPLHPRVHHGRGRLGRNLLRSAYSHRHRRRSHADVHGGRVRQLADAHSHQQHGQRRELRWATCPRARLTALGAAASFAAPVRSRAHADHHRGGLHGPAGLQKPGLHLHVSTSSVVCGT